MRSTVTMAVVAATIGLGAMHCPEPVRAQSHTYRGTRSSGLSPRDEARAKLKQEQWEREEKARKEAEAIRTGGYRVEGGPDRGAQIQQDARDEYLRSVQELERVRAEARRAARQQRAEPLEPTYWRRTLRTLLDVPVSLSMIGLGLLVGLLIGLRVRRA